ncbi:beta-ketoacyl-[acyl-carrier-protein] synthase family protein [Tundrisphaera lichenicola]|uniref:beta-ketoacyl-[acyl-carrier-protein] synthase family protein n=1 Tax=Tundrisphaera lichenicola TaxID=2029860 RepID=UPI003EBF603C
MRERVVVVGHSAVTCLGRDIDATWAGLVAGRSGIRRHTALSPDSYLVDLAGMVEDFGPGSPTEDPAVSRLGARSIHLALASARAAWADAGLDHLAGRFDPDRVALAIGSAFGGMDLHEAELVKSSRRKSLSASPYLVPGLLINQMAGQVAQHLGLYGPSIAPANACATGGHAIALGGMFLRSGEADLAICGGAESAFTPLIVNGFATMKALAGRRPGDRAAEDPGQASRPFSVDRSGFVMAEGAGMVVLATESTAHRLGLPIQAELAGWALNTDGYHMAMPSGERIAKCLSTALRRSEVRPEEVDYYNAHGTSTPVNDRVETQAIKDTFGDRANQLPISSIKGALGHGLGAASAIEAVVCVRALRERVIPPTINYQADPELDLDYVPDQARSVDLKTVISASFGFGGTNNALILRRGDL